MGQHCVNLGHQKLREKALPASLQLLLAHLIDIDGHAASSARLAQSIELLSRLNLIIR